MNNNLDPLDLLSGKVAQNEFGTYWFKEAGDNMPNNLPIYKNLHRKGEPAIITKTGRKEWWEDGVIIKYEPLSTVGRHLNYVSIK